MSDPEAIVVLARYLVSDGAEATVAQLLGSYVPLVEAEPGCLFFRAHQSRDDPRSFALMESYRDQAAFDAHVESLHYLSIARDQIRPLLEERHVEFYGPALGT